MSPLVPTVFRGSSRRACLVAGLLLSLISATWATPNILPAPRQQKPVLLSGGRVVTVSGPILEPGDVLLVEGRIAQVAAKITAPAGAEVIDVRGRSVYPGLIAAHTQLGLMEIGSARATNDVAEIGPLNPNARTQTALNPDSEHLPVTRANGVLTALVVPADRPGAGARLNLIAGTSTLIRLDGWTWEDLTVRPAVAMHLHWPSMRLSSGASSVTAVATQQKNLDAQVRQIDEAFAAARAYALAKTAGQPPADTDLRWEAMLPVLRGEQRVFVHADELKQIRAALAFARRQKIAITLVGGLDAWRVADELKAANVPVIISGTERLPSRRDDDYEAAYANPARLHAAGVQFCIAGLGMGDLGHERNLPIHAARAAAHGLPRDVALRSVTLSAAELLGVGAELGSIEPGKRATLIVTDGDPLEIPTQVQLAFIDGGRIDLRSRHTMLYEKFSERLQRVRDGR
jgi:imidazolonepropionase-like amidohydrolase